MRKSLRRLFFAVSFFLMLQGVRGAVVLSYATSAEVFYMAPSSTLDIPIFLRQVLTDGSPSPIIEGGGMFSMGFQVVRDPDVAEGPVSLFQVLPNNAQFDDVVDATVVPDNALLWEQQNEQFGNPIYPDMDGYIFLGTLRLQAPAILQALTGFTIQRYSDVLETNLIYNGDALDGQMGTTSFSIVAVPEPSHLPVFVILFAASGMFVKRLKPIRNLN